MYVYVLLHSNSSGSVANRPNHAHPPRYAQPSAYAYNAPGTATNNAVVNKAKA